MTAYYNENDRFAAAWLRILIDQGLIAPGDVDERDIRDVRPADLIGYTQCHFFAGIGGWSFAFRLAGWADSWPAWSGSCPCQPFAQAGQGLGFADERHLWPDFFHLIQVSGPAVVFGEQVASPDGLLWVDLVQTDLEGSGYAFGTADLCAAGIGAPHIRQRLVWVADADSSLSGQGSADLRGRLIGGDAFAWAGSGGGVFDRMGNAERARPLPAAQRGLYLGEEGPGSWNGEPERSGSIGRLADTGHNELSGRTPTSETYRGSLFKRVQQGPQSAPRGDIGRLSDASGAGLPLCEPAELCGTGRRQEGRAAEQFRCSPWADVEWLACRDGKFRPAQPGIFPLANGVSNRVGLLRGAGNAIVPEVTAEFIQAFIDFKRSAGKLA